MRKKIMILLAIVFVAILIRFLFSAWGTHMQSMKMKANRASQVTVSVVGKVMRPVSFTVPARVLAKSRIDIIARIDGYLTNSYFNEGDNVKQGQVLFTIEPQQYQYAAQKAGASLANMRAQQIYYDKQCARSKQLVAKDYIAKSQYDNAVAQRDAYRAQAAYSASDYRDAQRNLSYTRVRTPVSGRVGMINVTVGNFVSMNSQPLTTVYSVKPMYVTFPMEVKDFETLTAIDGSPNVKRRVEYTFSTGAKYNMSGVQNFRDNQVDQSTGTIKMRATFSNADEALLAGDFGRITIYSNKSADIPIIPTKAVQANQQGKFVYVVDKGDIPKLVYIKTMNQEGDNTLVETGLNVGDRVIDSGTLKVMPGMKVEVISEQQADMNKAHKQNILIKVLKKIKHLIFRGRN